METLEKVYSSGVFGEYFKVARVGSWLGWIFSFAFGSIFLGLPPLERLTIVLFAFLFATARIFVLNQYFDRMEDRENEIKSNLPIASGRIAPRTALVLSFSSIALCLLLIALIDVNLITLFLIYLTLWTIYSAPPFRLKTVPILDFIVSGVGAGLLPFLMGVGTSSPSNVTISIVLLSALPLISAHSSGHILQALGDYEADHETEVQTFVVKYGRKKGVIVMGLLSLITGLLPFTYAAFGLLSPSSFLLFFMPIPFCIPIAKRYIDALKHPSAKNIVNLQKTARKYGIIILFVVGTYVLVGKILGLL
ncbi:MAG: UbiA prenyltransferase family protein [Thermoproteota archaeon]|nr:UbiA prenyltransferase family protein [Thermoproteota archaeon]